MNGLRPITVLKLAVRTPSTITLRIVVATSPPLLLMGPLGGIALLLRVPGELSHLLTDLLAKLLQLPHCLHRVGGREEVRHRTGWSTRRKRWRNLPRHVGVVILHLLKRLRRIRIYIASATERPTAARLFEGPAATLELLSPVRRIEVAPVMEAALEAADCGAGREGRLIRRWTTKRKWRNGARLRFRWRGSARDVGPVLDRLDEVVGEQFGVWTCLCSLAELSHDGRFSRARTFFEKRRYLFFENALDIVAVVRIVQESQNIICKDVGVGV